MDDEKRPIKDNPSNKKIRDEINSMNILLTAGNLFGVVNKEQIEALREIQASLDEITTIPDKYNGFFSRKGWIAYESLNFEMMKKSVELASQGMFDEAETEILNYYNKDNIRFIISRGARLEAFQFRKQLALYALNEYTEKHYYACVPLLLIIIDGLVNDISKDTGFFAEKTDVTSWDSIAGHYTGLTALKKITSVA